MNETFLPATTEQLISPLAGVKIEPWLVKPAHEALGLGYSPPTTSYNTVQGWMLQRVIDDMRRLGSDFLVVREHDGYAIYRRGITRVTGRQMDRRAA